MRIINESYRQVPENHYLAFDDYEKIKKLLPKINDYLKTRQFPDQIKVINPDNHQLFKKEDIIKKDILIDDIIGTCHGTYCDYKTWSSIFLYLKRLEYKDNFINTPHIIFHPKETSKDAYNHFLLYELNNKYYVSEGMHRAVIAKFGGVKEFKDVQVQKISLPVNQSFLEYFSDQGLYFKKDKYSPEYEYFITSRNESIKGCSFGNFEKFQIAVKLLTEKEINGADPQFLQNLLSKGRLFWDQYYDDNFVNINHHNSGTVFHRLFHKVRNFYN